MIFKIKRSFSKCQSFMWLLSGSSRKGRFNGPSTKINILFSEPSSREKLIQASLKKFEISLNVPYDSSTENDKKVNRGMISGGESPGKLQVVRNMFAYETVKIILLYCSVLIWDLIRCSLLIHTAHILWTGSWFYVSNLWFHST